MRVRLRWSVWRPESVMRTRTIRRSCVVDLADRVPGFLEVGHDAGHARGLHLLEGGELAEGDGAEALDGGERGLGGRGEVLAGAHGLLADAAGEAGVGEAELGREHLRSRGFRSGRRGRRSGPRTAWRREAASRRKFTKLISEANYLPFWRTPTVMVTVDPSGAWPPAGSSAITSPTWLLATGVVATSTAKPASSSSPTRVVARRADDVGHLHQLGTRRHRERDRVARVRGRVGTRARA